ncbi:MAG: M23 family metallopeptidase [Candidatus Krumholzibacteriota bacterium]|nr:M23 family metallopeptidase [Candidatus Krumholzibacteriota bacterium]
MKKETFSIIVVPHDLKKTRTYRVPYPLFYLLVVVLGAGLVAMVVFMATYGRLLVKAQETVMLERQVAELTRRNEQIGDLTRKLLRLHAMDLQVRRMLGLEISPEDSVAIRVADEAGAEDGSAVTPSEEETILRALPSSWPVKGYITRGFSVTGGEEDQAYHAGIDIGVPRGTPVRAAAPGTVVEAGWDDIWGYYVLLDHGVGIKTLYGHNGRLVVMKGERVGRGQTVAFSGDTGRSSAPHLHFAVTENNVPVDPLKYLIK